MDKFKKDFYKIMMQEFIDLSAVDYLMESYKVNMKHIKGQVYHVDFINNGTDNPLVDMDRILSSICFKFINYGFVTVLNEGDANYKVIIRRHKSFDVDNDKLEGPKYSKLTNEFINSLAHNVSNELTIASDKEVQYTLKSPHESVRLDKVYVPLFMITYPGGFTTNDFDVVFETMVNFGSNAIKIMYDEEGHLLSELESNEKIDNIVVCMEINTYLEMLRRLMETKNVILITKGEK